MAHFAEVETMPAISGRGKAANPETVAGYNALVAIKAGKALKVECTSEKERNSLLAGIRNMAAANNQGVRSSVQGTTFYVVLTGQPPAVRGPRAK